jgi:copper homeostasis protein CutC
MSESKREQQRRRQIWFAGFVVGTLLNDKLTDEERLRSLAERAEQLGFGRTLDARGSATEPWLLDPE